MSENADRREDVPNSEPEGIPGPEEFDEEVDASSRTRGLRTVATSVAGLLLIIAMGVQLIPAVWVPSVRPRPSGSATSVTALDQALFGDARHGVVVMKHCLIGSSPCSSYLWATSDGGATWSRRSLPSHTSDSGHAVELRLETGLGQPTLVLLGNGRLVYDRPDDVEVSPADAASQIQRDLGTPGSRWISDDQAQTWHEVAREATESTDVVPTDGTVIVVLHYQFWPPLLVSLPEVQVVRPDGSSARLRNAPRPNPDHPSPQQASDGSLWIWLFNLVPLPPTPEFPKMMSATRALAVSRDRGRTWQLVNGRGTTGHDDFYTIDGRSLYVVRGLSQLVASHDSGRTWRTLNLSSGSSVWPAPDGGVLVSNPAGLYRLDERSAALTPVAGVPPIAAISAEVGCVIGFGPDYHTWYVSTDGVRFSPGPG